MKYTINEERLSAEEYIEFLKHTDLGSRYPQERFHQRIDTLVNRVSISLAASNSSPDWHAICQGWFPRLHRTKGPLV